MFVRCAWWCRPNPVPVLAALGLYLLVQQVENNLLVPKIQGDAVELHPAIVMAAIIIGGSLAGLLWLDIVRHAGHEVTPLDYARVGMRVGLPAIVAGTDTASRASAARSSAKASRV